MNQPIIFSAKINADVQFGTNVKLVDPVNLYGCAIDDDCFVGPFTEI